MSQRGCLLSLTALFCAALDDLWTGFGSRNTHRKCFYCLSFALSPPASNRTKEIVIMNTHNKHKKKLFQSLWRQQWPREPRECFISQRAQAFTPAPLCMIQTIQLNKEEGTLLAVESKEKLKCNKSKNKKNQRFHCAFSSLVSVTFWQATVLSSFAGFVWIIKSFSLWRKIS